MNSIAERLERKFAECGFAEPSVADLRDAAGVSLRTLYRYFPSRDDMVVGALKHRHQRYLSYVFDDLPQDKTQRLDTIFDRIRDWMLTYAPAGCIFQNALAAKPHDRELEALLLKNKQEMGEKLALHLDSIGKEPLMRQIHEGAIQSWIFQHEEAIEIARDLARSALSGTASSVKRAG